VSTAGGSTPLAASEQPSSDKRKIPLVIKLIYTAFVLVMVPVYLRAYGPTNFLYFCDAP